MTLKVLVKDATFRYDHDIFSKMDPYVVLTIGTKKQKTKTCKEGGKTPSWNQTLTFPLSVGDTSMKLQAWDEDPSNDDFIGSATVSLSKFTSILSQQLTQSIEVFHKGQNVGRVMLVLQYFPPEGLKWADKAE